MNRQAILRRCAQQRCEPARAVSDQLARLAGPV